MAGLRSILYFRNEPEGRNGEFKIDPKLRNEPKRRNDEFKFDPLL